MMNSKKMAALWVFVLIAAVPFAVADAQKTNVTFDNQVALPGLLLQPGSYVFKVTESDRDQKTVIQIFNADGSQFLGNELAIIDHKATPGGRSLVTYEKPGTQSIPEVKTWFMPGKNYGLTFVYPKDEAKALAKANQIEVPSSTMDTSAWSNQNQPEQMMQGAVTNISPAGTETPWQPQSDRVSDQAGLKQQNQQGSQSYSQQQSTSSSTDQDRASSDQSFDKNGNVITGHRLPRTASNMPLFGLVGLLSLGAALVISFATRS
jgi:hypothetical protein